MAKRAQKKYSRAPRRAYKYAVKVPRPLALNELRMCIEQNPNIMCDNAGNAWMTMWSAGINASAAPNNFTFFDSAEYLRIAPNF